MANLFDTCLSDEKFIHFAFDKQFDLKSTADVTQLIENRYYPSIFLSCKEEDDFSNLLGNESHANSTLIDRADNIVKHKFDLLGSEIVDLGPDINWHMDFKSDYRWSQRKYFKEIEIPYAQADIKIPWELSRFQHLMTLGQVYWITGDEKYAREFVDQISHWIDHNKPMLGVNWSCTMDVAIRVCNWIAGYHFFKDSTEITEEFLFRFLKSLYQHGKHIMVNLENRLGIVQNHYLANIVAMIYLGVLFPEFKEAEKWKVFGIRELKKEMEKQVYPDGCDFEASTCYHRLVLELFFYPTLLVVINQPEFNGNNYRGTAEMVFGKEFTNRLYRMFEAVLYLLKPNGMMPQIGDNDSGRLHVFANRDVLDMRYLLSFGAVFFNESKFKVKEYGFFDEVLWVLGGNAHRLWESLRGISLADIGSTAFRDAGWFVMRNNRDFMIISCGPNGQNGNGGHCHNDKLSFELCIDGKDVFVDPGTYTYTSEPDMRNLYRSTRYHNTVMIAGEEQNRIDRHDLLLFTISNDAGAKVVQWTTEEDADVFIGEHRGYERLSPPVIHQREVRFRKKEGIWEIIDRFRGTGEHELQWNIVVSPDFCEEPPIESSDLKWSQERGSYSPEYGVQTETVKLKSVMRKSLPCESSFRIIRTL